MSHLFRDYKEDKKTRTVLEYLHHFCRECIDKGIMRASRPTCCTHCASRRSLRDVTNYDALISTLYPNIIKYEEEKFAFGEEERAHNKKVRKFGSLVLALKSDYFNFPNTVLPHYKSNGLLGQN